MSAVNLLDCLEGMSRSRGGRQAQRLRGVARDRGRIFVGKFAQIDVLHEVADQHRHVGGETERCRPVGGHVERGVASVEQDQAQISIV